MSSLAAFSTDRFKLLAIAAFAGLVASVYHYQAPVSGYLSGQADRLVGESGAMVQSEPEQALLRLRLASLISSRPDIIRRQAELELKLDRPADAIKTLRRLPLTDGGYDIAAIQFRTGQYEASLATLDHLIGEKGSSQYFLLKADNLLELDRGDDAAGAAKQALSYSLGDKISLRKLGLAYLASGKQKDYDQLAADNDLDLDRARLSPVALAEELYADGLVRTSLRVLKGIDNPDSAGALLLAKAELSLGGQGSAERARDVLTAAIAADPGNLELHRLLKETFVRLSDQAGIDREEGLINSLETGKP